MTLTLHGIRNCDTVKRARAWLDERAIAHRFRDFKTEAPDEAALRRWCAAAGWERLLNRAGNTFRRLPEAERVDLDEDRAIALMLAHPSAIRRPVVEADETILVGFRPDEFERALRRDAGA
ncbi:arsenate reductase [Aureimonas flava]|uniref:Arsenate reductase n=1 Tax=Aureimonas flava TaxID=2320271 RepID=A0A3A1WP68_9HYPH|nr:arsenate reductase [Aureimonas flava]RIY02535.1 arsenate reductase [Aureimonas flava]